MSFHSPVWSRGRYPSRPRGTHFQSASTPIEPQRNASEAKDLHLNIWRGFCCTHLPSIVLSDPSARRCQWAPFRKCLFPRLSPTSDCARMLLSATRSLGCARRLFRSRCRSHSQSPRHVLSRVARSQSKGLEISGRSLVLRI